MLMLKEYSYLFDIMYAVVNGEKLPADEVNILGGRKSGKTIAYEILIGLLCTFPRIRMGIFIFKHGKEAFEEIFEEMQDTLESLNISYRASKAKKQIQVGEYTLRFYFTNTMVKGNKAQKAGMARVSGIDYGIRLWDERYQFNEQDVRALKEATRGTGGNNIQWLDLNACNPWAKSSPYIQYCANIQNWDLNQLKLTGSQIGIYERTFEENFIDGEGKAVNLKLTKRIIMHYTNWRITRHLLGESEILGILETWNIDRNRAMVVDYGMPGYETGAIYTHELHKVGNVIFQEHTWLWGGGDYGWSQREVGGKTAFLFGGASIETGIDVYEEYFQDNAKHPKPVNILVKEIVDFYIFSMQKYCNKLRYQSWQQLNVRVDNMARELIHLLNEECRIRKINWLSFSPCRKYPISDRIVFLLATLGSQFFRINPLCKGLKSDLEMASYEDTEVQKRIKKYDHVLNALEYGCEKFMYSFVKILQATSFLRK